MAEQTFGYEDLKRILVDRLGVPDADVPTDLDVSFDVLGLDSLAMVELQLEVEQRYGVVVTAGEDAIQVTSLRGAIEYVNSKLGPAVAA